jgi:hypothetical protein
LCPNCQKRGWLKITTENRKYEKQQIPSKTLIENYGVVPIEKTIPIERRLHPKRYLSLFASMVGVNTADNPPINPVHSQGLQEKNPSYKRLHESILDFIKSNVLLSKMIPVILEKYQSDPKVYALVEKFVESSKIMRKYLKTIYDDRYSRSYSEWSKIAKYAGEQGVNAASKRYYGVDLAKNKKVFLSSKQIKNKRNSVTTEKDIDVGDFMVCHYLPVASFLVQNIISGDQELLNHYNRLSLEYDNIRKQLEDERNKHIVSNQKPINYTYKYVKVVHYDQVLYNQQKVQHENGIRRSKPDGRVECLVKEADLPCEIRSRISTVISRI